MSRYLHNELVQYFLITFGITWLLWLAPILNSSGVQVPVIFLMLGMMASFTPTVVGLLFIKRHTSLRFYLKEKFVFSNVLLWVVIPVIFFGIAYISYLFTDGDSLSITVMWVVTFIQVLFIGGALGEEFGWRGFAYPRLREIMSPIRATLILGILWSIWHLPLFFMEGTVQANIPMWQFMLQNTLIAFYYLYFYERSNGNILLMIYLHAIANTASAIIPYWQTNNGRWIGFILLFIVLILLNLVDYMRRRRKDAV